MDKMVPTVDFSTTYREDEYFDFCIQAAISLTVANLTCVAKITRIVSTVRVFIPIKIKYLLRLIRENPILQTISSV